ncbi:MAG: TolB protein [Patescibacteria group bacterium]|nr:TolB protein [Patescibacteria group bacterium]
MAAVINTDGTQRVDFTDPYTGLDNGGVAWSPDSQKVLISRLEWGASNPNFEYTKLRLIMSDVSGVSSRDLSSYDPEDVGAGIDIAPVWSPDASKIASNFALYPEASLQDDFSTIRIYNPDSSGYNEINFDFQMFSHPQMPMLWYGDSKRIVATVAGPENDTNQRNYDLYSIDTTDLSGSTYVNLTAESNDNISAYARWPNTNLGSSAKQEILFVTIDRASPDSSADIYKMNTDGTNKVRLTDSPGNDIYWDDGGSNINPLETANEPAIIPTAPKSGAVINAVAFSTVLIGSVVLFAIIYKNNHLHKSRSERL